MTRRSANDTDRRRPPHRRRSDRPRFAGGRATSPGRGPSWALWLVSLVRRRAGDTRDVRGVVTVVRDDVHREEIGRVVDLQHAPHRVGDQAPSSWAGTRMAKRWTAWLDSSSHRPPVAARAMRWPSVRAGSPRSAPTRRARKATLDPLVSRPTGRSGGWWSLHQLRHRRDGRQSRGHRLRGRERDGERSDAGRRRRRDARRRRRS